MEEISRERAQVLMREGDLEGAVAVLKEVTAQNPSDAMAWQMMGAALGALGQASDSIGAFQQAAELQPTSARVQFNLAVALVKSDRTGEARSHLERALALDPGYEQARVKLKEIGGIAPDTVAPPPPDPMLGGGAPVANPVPVAPPQAPVATPSAAPAAPPAGLGAVGGPATPPPAAPTAPAAPAAPSLQPIGGGLAPIGGGSAAPAPAPQPGAPAPGGMAGLGSVGGGAAPASGTPPLAPPPSAGPGGYAPPPGAYRSPDAPKRYAPDVNAGNILTTAIVSIFCFGLILGPYAIVKASQGLQILAEYPEDDQAPRGTLRAAQIIGIVSTVLTTLGIIVRIAMFFSR